MFGGWQTRYYLGYNVPTYEYLFQSGSHHVLSMRFIDHILDDQVIDEVVVKIVLPEGSKSAVHAWGFASLSAVYANIVSDLQEHSFASTIPS